MDRATGAKGDHSQKIRMKFDELLVKISEN